MISLMVCVCLSVLRRKMLRSIKGFIHKGLNLLYSQSPPDPTPTGSTRRLPTLPARRKFILSSSEPSTELQTAPKVPLEDLMFPGKESSAWFEGLCNLPHGYPKIWAVLWQSSLTGWPFSKANVNWPNYASSSMKSGTCSRIQTLFIQTIFYFFLPFYLFFFQATSTEHHD